MGPEGPALATRLAPILRAAFTPARLVFGTDWPHTRFEGADRAANALDELGRWLRDIGDHSSCLDDAPRKLFALDVTPAWGEGGEASSRPIQDEV